MTHKGTPCRRPGETILADLSIWYDGDKKKRRENSIFWWLDFFMTCAEFVFGKITRGKQCCRDMDNGTKWQLYLVFLMVRIGNCIRHLRNVSYKIVVVKCSVFTPVYQFFLRKDKVTILYFIINSININRQNLSKRAQIITVTVTPKKVISEMWLKITTYKSVHFYSSLCLALSIKWNKLFFD